MKVLFVCRENSCRSVIAEAVFNALSKEHKAESAGVVKAEKFDEKAIETLSKYGYKIEKRSPRRLDEVNLNEFDVIVAVCDDVCVKVSEVDVLRWRVEDPKKTGNYENVLKVLEDKIRRLLEEIRDEGS